MLFEWKKGKITDNNILQAKIGHAWILNNVLPK